MQKRLFQSTIYDSKRKDPMKGSLSLSDVFGRRTDIWIWLGIIAPLSESNGRKLIIQPL